MISGKRLSRLCIGAVMASAVSSAFASSHREAPFITEMPKVDGTDFYMFRSYESGRGNFVTLIANYLPLQDAYGGPNYFSLDPEALYEIHIDNDGDAVEDISFQFRMNTTYNNIALDTGGPEPVTIPFINAQPDGIGPEATDLSLANIRETYQVTVVREGRRSSANPTPANNLSTGTTTFRKPYDYIGEKSFNGDYETYAQKHIYDIEIPGCSVNAGDGPGVGRVFVGQRKEGFVVNLGEVFDLVNLNPVGLRDAESNIIGNKNITSLALEIPVDCLTAGSDPVIGAWTTASLRQARVLNPTPQGPNNPGPSIEGGPWTQVSRLGSPLVNEVVIGIDKKDLFNASHPSDDVGNFGAFVLYPTLPVVVDLLFPGATTIPGTPRNDLLAAFVTGVPGFNQPANLTVPGEMLRLNTDIAPAVPADQNDLGVLGGDVAGFPNGRRPYDDVVDIALTVAEGAVCGFTPEMNCGDDTSAPNGTTIFTDGASSPGPTATTAAPTGAQSAGDTYLDVFPYLNTPIPGSPNSTP